jgi:hypothetical protein
MSKASFFKNWENYVSMKRAMVDQSFGMFIFTFYCIFYLAIKYQMINR